MGFFSKKSITIDQLAELLGDFTWEQYQSPFTEKQWGKPTPEQRREILILNMLAATRAIHAALAEHPKSEDLLNAYHVNIYKRLSRFDAERAEFERLLQKRYQTYYKLLNPNDKNWLLKLGQKFSAFYGEKDLALQVASGSIFSSLGVNFKQFIDEILSKAKLTE